MHIAGVVVRTRPEHARQVQSGLLAIAGVEVHAVTPEGRLVVTVESDDSGSAAGRFNELQQLPQVLSAALVYEQSEAESATGEEGQ
jgi:nitrate reductase NapD